jgi:hypothetical protein
MQKNTMPTEVFPADEKKKEEAPIPAASDRMPVLKMRLPAKEWAKRKKSRKMAKQSRKRNRK